MAPRLRDATGADWVAMGAGPEPPSLFDGFAAEDGGRLIGLGGIYYATDGRWWMFVMRAPGVRSTMTAHRAARLLVETYRSVGMTVHAMPDLRAEGSELWMRRLGFEPTDEERQGHRVWVLNTQPPQP